MLMKATAPRAQSPQMLLAERKQELRADKGPKDSSFDGWFLGSGRRGVEKALKLDKKR